MKKLFGLFLLVFVGVVAFAGGGQSPWSSDSVNIYEGQSEIFFSYTGPNGVGAFVYENDKGVGTIDSGQKVRRIISDGTYTYEIRPFITDPSTRIITEDLTGIKKINILANSNKITIVVKIENRNGRNIVLECAQSEKITIIPKIRPQKLAAGEKIDKRLFEKIGDDVYKLKTPNNFTDVFSSALPKWDEVIVGVSPDDMILLWSYTKKNITSDEFKENIYNLLYVFNIKGGGNPPSEERAYTEERKFKDGTTVYCKPGTKEGIVLFYNSEKKEGGFTVYTNIDYF